MPAAARAPCSCRQTPLHSRHIPPAASSAVRQLRPGPGARPSSACGPLEGTHAHVLLSFLDLARSETPADVCSRCPFGR